MKNTVWMAMAFLCLIACKQEPGYEIKGELPGMPDGLKVYLNSRLKGISPIDSTITEKGQFIFTGRMDIPAYCEIKIPDKNGDWGKNKIQEIWVENAKISVNSHWDSLRYNTAQVTGSASHDLYASFMEKRRLLYKRNAELNRDYMMNYDQYAYQGIFTPEYTAAGIEIVKKQREISLQIRKMEEDFVAANPRSAVEIKVLGDLLRSGSEYTEEEVNQLLAYIDPELRNTPAYIELEKKATQYCNTAIGKKFIDFAVVDAHGKEGRLSDYIQPGKYNLLECWASWCGPCRAEIPHLKHVHSVYGKQFNIIAVSVDKDEAEWKKALQEENAGYLQLRNIPDAQGKKAIHYYGFIGIPYTLLLDGEGRIVEAEVRGATLDMILDELNTNAWNE